MGADLSRIGLLARREIKARIAGPLLRAFMKETGEERGLEIVEEVITALASPAPFRASQISRSSLDLRPSLRE